MIINSVQLENIRSYKKESVRFDKKSILLKGDIGSGKSTILHAIEFALFGILRTELSGNSLLRHSSNEGKVVLDFSIDNNNIVIERTLKRSKDKVEQNSGSITINNSKLEATPVELKAKIFDLLGYPKTDLSRNKNLLYRYTVYTPQEEMKRIIYESTEVRLNLLRSVFDLDKYKRVRENSGIFLRHLREQKRHYEGMLVDFEQKKKELTENSALLEQKSQESNLFNPELVKIAEEVKLKNEELLKIEEIKVKITELNKEVTKTKALVNLKQKQNDNYDLEINKLTEQSIKPLKEIQEPKNIEEKKEELTGIQKKKELIHKSLVESRTKQDHSKKIIEKLDKLDSCPVCMQNVPHEHKENILGKEKQEVTEHTKLISQNEKILVNLIERENLLKQEIDLLNTQKQEFIRFTEQKKNLEDKKKLLEEYKKQNDLISNEKVELKKKEKEIEQEINKLKPSEENYEKTKKDLDLLKEKQKEALIQQARIKEQITHYKLQKLKIEKEVEEKTIILGKLQKAEIYEDWFNTFFTPLTETIEKQVMGRIYHNFNHLFEDWFNVLIDDEYLNARLDESFTPLIQQNGYETSVEFLSGGEKTACALAYRLALNQSVNDVISTIKTKKLLILDEPTDGFSSQQLDKMRDVLNQLEADQVILVSHEGKIESFVEHVMQVTKEGNTSAIAQ